MGAQSFQSQPFQLFGWCGDAKATLRSWQTGDLDSRTSLESCLFAMHVPTVQRQDKRHEHNPAYFRKAVRDTVDSREVE